MYEGFYNTSNQQSLNNLVAPILCDCIEEAVFTLPTSFLASILQLGIGTVLLIFFSAVPAFTSSIFLSDCHLPLEAYIL